VWYMQGEGGRRSGRERAGEMRASVLMQQQRLGDTDTKTRRARGKERYVDLSRACRGRDEWWLGGVGIGSGCAGMGAGLFACGAEREAAKVKVQGFLGPDGGRRTADGRWQMADGRMA
jgi:hypothetical protein